ncbi:MAG: ABC transporter permease [Deltaproteobacteria bacterium]|nr:ABC transporter permease [Deltaproteobacteria bacterium]
MHWEYKLGFRMLLGRKRQFFSPMTLIALCGIAFGMTATLVSLSVITGFQQAYEKAILGFNAHLILVQDGDVEDPEILQPVLDGMKVTDEEARYWKEHALLWRWFKYFGLGTLSFFSDPKMEELEDKGIVASSAFVYREGLAILPDDVSGIVLKGVDPANLRTVYPIRYELLSGTPNGKDLEETLSPFDARVPPVMVGKNLFDRLFPGGLKPPAGESSLIRLMIPKGDAEEKHTLKDYAQDFTVVGFFESGLYEFDSQFILTGLPVMQELFHLGKRVSGVEMVLDDPNKAPGLARTIEAQLPIPADLISWDQLNEALFSAMQMEKTLFLIVMLLIILVASFNVMGIIFMMVLNRQGDLAVLKAMGALGFRLRRSFTLQGGVVGVAGAFVGSVLSALCLWSLDRFQWFDLDPQIYFISHLPVAWSPSLWIGLIGAALLICTASASAAAGVALKYGSLRQTFR